MPAPSLQIFPALTLAIVLCRWAFAARIFGRHLGRAAYLTYRHAVRSSLRFYVAASVFGIIMGPLAARFDLAPPGIPLAEFLLGLVGIGTVGLPPSFLLVGGSTSGTIELSWKTRRVAPLGRTAHMMLLRAGNDPTEEMRTHNANWRRGFVALARAAKIIVLDSRGSVSRERVWEIDWLARNEAEKTVVVHGSLAGHTAPSGHGFDLFPHVAFPDDFGRVATALLQRPWASAIERDLVIDDEPALLDQPEERGGADFYIRCPKCSRRVPLILSNSVPFCSICSIRLPRLSYEVLFRLLIAAAIIGVALIEARTANIETITRVALSLLSGQLIETAGLLGNRQNRTRFSPLLEYGLLLLCLVLVPPSLFPLRKPWVVTGYVASNLSSAIALAISLRRYPEEA